MSTLVVVLSNNSTFLPRVHKIFIAAQPVERLNQLRKQAWTARKAQPY